MQKIISKAKYLFILPLLLFMALLSSCMNFELVKELEILHDGEAVYMVNSFKYSDYEVKATYSNGKEEIIPLTEDMIVDYDALAFYKAGEHTVTIEYGRKRATFDIIVTKNTFSDDIVLNKKEVMYTGETFKVEVEGILPAGTKVYYPSGNEFSNAAIYDIKAVLICEGYNLKELNTTLTIKRATYDLSGITFNNKEVEYNAGPQSLEIEGELPEGLVPTYYIRKYTNAVDENEYVEGSEATNADKYQVRVEFQNLNNNYYPVNPMEVFFTIKPKEYLLTGVEFNDVSFVYDGAFHEIPLIDPNNVLKPDKIVFMYEEESPKDSDDRYDSLRKFVGTYNYSVYFYTMDSNYTVKEKMSATLTITPEVVKLNDVFFDGGTFDYDGEGHSIYCTADYYNCPEEKYHLPPAYTRFIGYKKAGSDEIVKEVSEVDAGKYKYYAYFEATDNNHVIDGDGLVEGWLEIRKQTIYLTNVVFESQTFTYDGEFHSLSYSFSDDVRYDFLIPIFTPMKTSYKEVGVYEINLRFASSSQNYVFEDKTFTAYLTIVEDGGAGGEK